MEDKKKKDKQNKTDIKLDKQAKKNNLNNKDKPKKEDQALLNKIQELEKKLSQISEESDSWKNKYYEAYANLDNTRKQIEKDNAEYRKYITMGVVDTFLPCLDALEMTNKMSPQDEAIKRYLQGYQMIFQMFQSKLEELGFTSFVPNIDSDFDATKMNVTDTVIDSVPNKIKAVHARAYIYKDRVLRPAQVVVSKLEEKEQKDTNLNEEDKDVKSEIDSETASENTNK